MQFIPEQGVCIKPQASYNLKQRKMIVYDYHDISQNIEDGEQEPKKIEKEISTEKYNELLDLQKDIDIQHNIFLKRQENRINRLNKYDK